MKYNKGFIAFFILSVFCYSNPANATDNFEINLQELHPTKPTATKPPATPAGSIKFDINLKELHSAKPNATKPATPARPIKLQTSQNSEAGPKQGESIYTVRPGDHLFLILMRRYRLTNDAAENLIPEVMRLNHISSPHGLTIGQRLNIPLPPPENTYKKTEFLVKKSSRKGSSASINRQPEPEGKEKTEISEAKEAEVKSTETLPEPAIVVQTPRTITISQAPQKRSLSKDTLLPAAVTISAAPSCGIARAIADRLGLLTPDLIKPQADQEIISAANAGLKVVVACGLSTAEIYTYERLLSQKDTTLLIFNGNEPYSRVVEKLANRLGLDYEPVSPDANGDLPLSFIFSKVGSSEQRMRLTIVPAIK
ncbi:MAG TPA: LysM domain-containing protein [Desulfuromonadaceae bacterium]|jgi:hypothetical protein